MEPFRATRFSKTRRAFGRFTTGYADPFERATMAVGIHLFPFRTEKLSPPAPMVLQGLPVGE